VRVAIVVRATPAAVWAELRDIASHVEWMADAAAIRFVGDGRRAGVGTTFECDTVVGPLRMTDVMTITEWRSRRAMGVRHVGVVTGTGRFTLRRIGVRRTRLVWDEVLTFPWWAGGRVGVLVASPVLRWVWRGNLRRLKARIEK
jgi:hypothetical protein